MKTQRHLALSLGLAFVLLATVGCGGGRTDLIPVQGKVTLDNQPLEKGKITLEATDGRGGVEGGDIINGEYSLKTTAGSKAVKIHAEKVVGQKKTYNTKDSAVEDVAVEAIPPRYNRNTELAIEVSTTETEHSFELTSKK
ncbi:hypothetical protein AB1L30_26475 [Bremerella sp. JC817]|uniref:hypothetical protein n=1 Tax=Bremerella sp. JC817 TaxID=3231756 RepID=UPI0034595F3A